MTRAPMILTGKPSLHALRFVAARLGVPVRNVAVVGDDPLVEMLMARRGGATALAVTTGTTSREAWEREPPARRPHGILRDLRDVLRWVAGPQASEGEPRHAHTRAAAARKAAAPARRAQVPGGTAARCRPSFKLSIGAPRCH